MVTSLGGLHKGSLLINCSRATRAVKAVPRAGSFARGYSFGFEHRKFECQRKKVVCVAATSSMLALPAEKLLPERCISARLYIRGPNVGYSMEVRSIVALVLIQLSLGGYPK